MRRRLLLCLSILVFPAVLSATEPAESAFALANALYAEGRFEEAVRAYEAIAASGHDGSVLRYNLGNTYFRLGDHGRALLNYERAALWRPGDPDIRANLRYLRSLTGAATCEPPRWARILFPASLRVGSRQLALWATGAWTLAFVAWAAARRFDGWRRGASWIAGLGLLGWLVAASSLGYRLVAVEWPDRLIVTAAGETAVRFEPADDGTVHFEVAQGSELRRTDARSEWTQVARCDGRRGWIPSADVEPL